MAAKTSTAALSRVAVWYGGGHGGTQKDMVLPTHAPISDYIADVVDTLSDDDTLTAPAGSQWTLARLGGPLKPGQSLHDARVSDGAVLELRAVRSTERYRAVIEDVVDAAAEAAAAAGRPFDESAARKAGLVGLAAGGVALCAAQWLEWIASGYSWWWALAGGLGAVVAFIGMWSAARRYEARDAATAWTVVWVAACAVVGQLIPISARTGALGVAHVVVCAVGVAVAAVCALLITGAHLAVTSAVVALAIVVAVVGAAAEYTGVAPSAIAAGALIAGLIGMQNAGGVAAGLARISLPKVPADGEKLDVGGEISAAELATVRIRSQRAVQMTTGLMVAAALTAAAAAVWTMDPHSYHYRVELVIVSCVAVVLVSWGRTMSNALQAFSMFTGAFIVIVGSAARLLFAWHAGLAPAIIVGAVAGVLVVLVVVAVVVAPRGVNPRVARALEVLAVVALVTVYPLAAWVTGVFGLLRDLRIG